MSIENEASISHEQRGSALAGLDGGRRLVASSGPAKCVLSAGSEPTCVLLCPASNPGLPGLVRPVVLSVLLCPPVLPGSQRAPVLPGASVLPDSGADPDNCDWHPGCSGVLHGAGRGCASEPASAAVPEATYGDPYGFLYWLNSIRASYGLGPVNYDQNLSNWAAMNNSEQMARGLGHFVMGSARRQNSAAGGGFPGAMWMASPAHRAALLDPTISWIGIAAAGAYWTFNAS